METRFAVDSVDSVATFSATPECFDLHTVFVVLLSLVVSPSVSFHLSSSPPVVEPTEISKVT